jgi:hypothetical protein
MNPTDLSDPSQFVQITWRNKATPLTWSVLVFPELLDDWQRFGVDAGQWKTVRFGQIGELIL